MAIALVSSVFRSGTGTTAAIDTTGASLIVMAAAAVSALSAVSDNKGNIWVPLSATDGTGGLQLYAAFNTISGTGHTFTCGAGTFTSIAIATFSGVAINHSLDTARQMGASSTTYAIPSITPVVNGSLLVAGLGCRSTGVYSIDGGFTIAQQGPFLTSTYAGVGIAYLIQTTAVAAGPTWTTPVSSAGTAAMAAFRPTSAGGGSGPSSYAFVG